jgi:hypothetical protein
MTACFSLPDCFLACKTTQELSVTQLARHVDLFHLVIADNQWPKTLSLPHGLASPIKPTTQLTQVADPWSQRGSPAVCISNKSFLSTLGVVLNQQYLISGAETQERLERYSGLGLLPWPLCPALSWTQTAELIPHVSGLWILDLTALPAFPSIISLSLPLLSTWPTPQVG